MYAWRVRRRGESCGDRVQAPPPEVPGECVADPCLLGSQDGSLCRMGHITSKLLTEPWALQPILHLWQIRTLLPESLITSCKVRTTEPEGGEMLGLCRKVK